MPQPEDGSLHARDGIAPNVRQFDENKKNPGSLLDILDDVRMPLELHCLCLPSIQALREWERLTRANLSPWKMIKQRNVSDTSMAF